MRTVCFSGDFFEIGILQGKIYRKNGMNLNSIKIDKRLFKKQLRIYKTHYPEFLEELKGIAKGGNFDENKTIYFFTTCEILYVKKLTKEACTIFGVKNENGIFVGRNYDWIPSAEKVFKIYKVKNPKVNTFLAITDMGITTKNIKPAKLFFFPEDIINDKGLFVGVTFAYGKKIKFGLSFAHLVKKIAENCSKVEEAIEIIKKAPLCFAKNFFIADRFGNMVVIEHTSEKFKILEPKNNILIKTNHYLHPELRKEDEILKENSTTSFLRYFETFQKLTSKKDSLKFGDIIKILGDKKSSLYQNTSRIKTIWSLALDMGRKKYKIYWNLHKKRKEKELKL